ncbi:helix-turn-helix transcriptional regulator [Actinomycetes bacterium KLBMP 9797]
MYRTITTLGPRSAGALARELGMPVHRVDEAFSVLRAVGAARMTSKGRSGRRRPMWVTLPPAQVVEALRSRRLRRVDPEAQARTHQAVVTALEGHGRFAGCASTAWQFGDGVRYLPSRDVTRRRLAELMAVERREHLAINTEQSFESASARAAAPLMRQVADRGVAVRVVGLPPADHDLHVDAPLFDRPLYVHREAPELPMKLLVIDRQVALFPVDPRDFERGYLEVSQPAMVDALVTLFERTWMGANDPRYGEVPGVVLSDRERALIRLLAGGHTDATAAVRLRISVRSVSNIMRALMDRFGVQNRFQLGLALGAARLASPPSPLATQEAS